MSDQFAVTVRGDVAEVSTTDLRKELTTVIKDVLRHPDITKVRIMRNGNPVGADIVNSDYSDDATDIMEFGGEDGDED